MGLCRKWDGGNFFKGKKFFLMLFYLNFEFYALKIRSIDHLRSLCS